MGNIPALSIALAIEIVVFGTAIVWLLAFIPAAVITALKSQWRLLGWGCLTAGFLWFAGALSLAPPASPWAQRFYDGELRARAGHPFRTQRSPRTFAVWAGIAMALIAVLGFLAARPSPILGVKGAVLGNSLPHRGGDSFFSLWPPLGPCEQRSRHVWSCSVYDDEGSGGTIDYQVKVHGLGCWIAKPTERGGRGNFSSCITILDYF